MMKKHWTQLPKNREKMLANIRASVKARRAHKKPHSVKKGEQTHGNLGTEAQEAYAFGRIEGWLQAYAQRLGIPERAFTARVGALLFQSKDR
jgi:hypothetical protein